MVRSGPSCPCVSRRAGSVNGWTVKWATSNSLALLPGNLSALLLGSLRSGLQNFHPVAILQGVIKLNHFAVDFPTNSHDQIYALEIQGDSMEPLYRDGDRIIVSPTSSIRRGDRVVVRTVEGEVLAKVLARQTAKVLELESINPQHENRSIKMQEVDWVARIIWASQ